MVHGLDTLRAINDRAVADAMPLASEQAIATTPEPTDEFAIVDVMGHQRFIGRLSEQVVAGTAFVRIDKLNADFSIKETRLIGASSIYMIRPLSLEEFMFEFAPKKQPSLLVDRRERYQVDEDDSNGPY